MPKAGLEPARPFGHQGLSLARLPISPLGRSHGGSRTRTHCLLKTAALPFCLRDPGTPPRSRTEMHHTLNMAALPICIAERGEGSSRNSCPKTRAGFQPDPGPCLVHSPECAEVRGIEPPGVTQPRYSTPVADHSAVTSKYCAEGGRFELRGVSHTGLASQLHHLMLTLLRRGGMSPPLAK